VDDDALIEALRLGRIGGAALDVFSTQPLPKEHPYLLMDNVIVTPHMAGITDDSMMRMGVGAASEALRVLDGRLPANLRNPEVVEHFRRRLERCGHPPSQGRGGRSPQGREGRHAARREQAEAPGDVNFRPKSARVRPWRTRRIGDAAGCPCVRVAAPV
jgi:hypothetical protein